MPSKTDQLHALLRTDFKAFYEKVFLELNPGTEYLPNWHVDAMAWRLEQVRQGIENRLIINLPPRYGKSHMVSVAFVAFLLGHDPSLKIIVVSYADKLAIDLSFLTRLVMQSDWYRKIFPGTKLSESKNTEQMFYTTKQGFRFAATPGGTLTGIGGDIIIIDDIIKPEDALSDALRTKANQFYSSTLLSRLNDKKNGPIIILGQRLHNDDLFGHVLEKRNWDALVLPAIAEENQEIEIGPGETYFRKRGEALHPEREDLDTLEDIKRDIGSMPFASQYQQQPVPPGGNLIKLAWFKRYDEAPPLAQYEAIVQSWDTAMVPGEGNDYSVCTTWGILGQRLYLLDVFREQLNYPDLRRTVVKLQNEFQATMVIVERAGSGISLYQDLRRAGAEWIFNLNPEGDKASRLAHQSAKIEAGMVYLPEKAPWLSPFESEIAAFPNGKHDDQVDSLTQFLRTLDFRPRPLRSLSLYAG